MSSAGYHNPTPRDGGFKKGPAPLFSPQYLVHNHGYLFLAIVSVILIGFLLPWTRSFFQIFVLPQYYETVAFPHENQDNDLYRNGWADLPTIFFYTLVWYVLHYTVQEHILRRVQSHMDMRPARQAKFTESFLVTGFSLYSLIHEIYIFSKLGIFGDFSLLWRGYPDTHSIFPLSVKMFFILQISYWLHKVLELFFQRLTKEEIASRSICTFILLWLFTFTYFTNLLRLGMAVSFIEFISCALFHISRMLYYSGNKISTFVFNLWNGLYIPVRLAKIAVGVYVLWYGLSKLGVSEIDTASGNFNTPLIRWLTLFLITSIQLYMLYNFFKVHYSRHRKDGPRLALEHAGTSTRRSLNEVPLSQESFLPH